MSHTARCDDVPFFAPTVPTIALPSAGQRVVPASGTDELVVWALRAGVRLWVSSSSVALLQFYEEAAGSTERFRAWVSAGTCAVDLPPGVSIASVRVTVEADQKVALWTKA